MAQILKPNNPQAEALKALREFRLNGGTKAAVQLPSGIGKTQLAVFDSMEASTVLYVAHRREILEQAIEAFKATRELRDSQIGWVTSNKKGFNKPFVFATIQTLSRPKNLSRLSKHHFDYVVIDECHHIAAESYANTMNYLHYNFLLGLTATPYRHDRKDILSFFDNNLIFQMAIEQGIEQKNLVPVVYNGLTDNVNYEGIEFNGINYDEEDLDKTLLIPERDKLVIDQYRRFIWPNKQVVGFCATVKHVERMVSLFNSHGIKAAGITYGTDALSRTEVIEAFRNKEYQVLFTRDIFNEGVDFPEMSEMR